MDTSRGTIYDNMATADTNTIQWTSSETSSCVINRSARSLIPRDSPCYERHTADSPTDVTHNVYTAPRDDHRPSFQLFSSISPKQSCLIARFTVMSFSLRHIVTFFFKASVDVDSLYDTFCSFRLSLKRLEVRLLQTMPFNICEGEKSNRQLTNFEMQAGN